MRVAQIVDGVDERLVVPTELVHHFAQILRCDGIETEMHVKYLKVVAVFGHPARLEHQRWPPTTRNLPPIARHRIRQSADCVDTSRFGKVTDVDMRRRHRKPLATLSLLIGRTTDRHSPRNVGTQPSSG